MEEDRSDELLTGYAGTEQVDKFQEWATENAKKAGDQKDRYNLSCKATDRSGTVESTQVVVKERIITGG